MERSVAIGNSKDRERLQQKGKRLWGRGGTVEHGRCTQQEEPPVRFSFISAASFILWSSLQFSGKDSDCG